MRTCVRSVLLVLVSACVGEVGPEALVHVGQGSTGLGTPFAIYDSGALRNGWWDNSSATHTLDSTAVLDGSNHTLSARLSGWGSLNFYAGRAVSATGYDTLGVRVNGASNANPSLTVKLQVRGSTWKAARSIGASCPGGVIPTNGWAQCLIPLSSLGVAAGDTVTGLYLQNGTGTALKTLYFGAIQVMTAAAPTVAVTVAPATATLLVGGTRQFTATVTGTSDARVVWSSDCGGVTAAGLYTAPPAPASCVVRATSVADATKAGAASILVSLPTLTVSVSPGSASLFTGATQQFSCTVTGFLANASCLWTVREGAAGGLIDATGGYTAPPGAGTFHVVATSAEDAARSAEATVTVTAPAPVSVAVSPLAATLGPGGVVQLAASVAGTLDLRVTWSILEGSAGGTVSGGGLYQAPAGAGVFHVVATSVADPGKSASATVTVSLASATTFTGLAPMPPRDGTPRGSWLTGEIISLRDRGGPDLVAFFMGSTTLHAAVSADDGATWAWVDPAVKVPGGKVLTIGQSSDGRIHLLSSVVALTYSRVALVRDAGNHITGFTAEVNGVVLPCSVNTNMDLRTQLIPGLDQAGNPTIFYAVYDDPGGTARGRIQAGKTRPAVGVAPLSTADFVRLDGAAGSTAIFSGGGGSIDSSHNNGVGLAQHPGSLDLWFQWGPIDTGDTIMANQNPVRRLRATPAGASSWVLGAAELVEAFSVYSAELGAVVSTPTSVWLGRFSPTGGYVIDRATASGVVVPGALPSPYPTARSGGYVTLAVNATETQAWAGGWISYDSASGVGTFWASHWDGTTWTRVSTTAMPDTWGVGRSTGWDHGLVLVALDPSTMAPSFATLRTLP